MRVYAFWFLLFCLLPLIVRRPIIGLTAYAVLNVTRPELFFWGGDQGAKALILVFGCMVIGMLINMEIDLSAIFKPHILLMFWIYLAIWASLWSADYQTSMAGKYATELFKLTILCILATMLLRKLGRFDILLSGILYSSTFLALWGIDQYFRGNTRLEGLGGDAMADSNYIAAHFVLFLPSAVQRAIYSDTKKQKLIGLFCALSMVGVILCTQSRGGLLGMVTGVFLLILTSKHKMKLIPIVVIAVLTLGPFFITEEYKARMGTMTQETEDMDMSARSRLVLWHAGWLIFLDKPIFGCGFGNYPWEKSLYEGDFMHLDELFREYCFGRPKVVHSTVFQVLSEGGLFLSIPFFSLFLGALWFNRRALKRARGRPHLQRWAHILVALQCGLIGYYVSMLFLNGLISVFSYFVVTLCAVIRYQLEDRREEVQPEDESLPQHAAA